MTDPEGPPTRDLTTEVTFKDVAGEFWGTPRREWGPYERLREASMCPSPGARAKTTQERIFKARRAHTDTASFIPCGPNAF